ncbi:hypothetical protein ERJ75_001342200 [Trypanosoma vivax]|nr:hypothetical protein ERJ75_001342200 [Trypanosoma vivax]
MPQSSPKKQNDLKELVEHIKNVSGSDRTGGTEIPSQSNSSTTPVGEKEGVAGSTCSSDENRSQSSSCVSNNAVRSASDAEIDFYCRQTSMFAQEQHVDYFVADSAAHADDTAVRRLRPPLGPRGNGSSNGCDNSFTDIIYSRRYGPPDSGAGTECGVGMMMLEAVGQARKREDDWKGPVNVYVKFGGRPLELVLNHSGEGGTFSCPCCDSVFELSFKQCKRGAENIGEDKNENNISESNVFHLGGIVGVPTEGSTVGAAPAHASVKWSCGTPPRSSCTHRRLDSCSSGVTTVATFEEFTRAMWPDVRLKSNVFNGQHDETSHQSRVNLLPHNAGSSLFPLLPSFSPTSFVRAYVGEGSLPWEATLNNVPAVIVSCCVAIMNIVVVLFLQNHVIDTRDHLGLFIVGTYLIFASHFVVYYFLGHYSVSFRRVSREKQFYTISNLIKAGILASLVPFATIHLTYIIVLDEWDTNTLRNLGCIYAVPDFVSMLIVKRMSWSTWFHHLCVLLFNFFSIMNDYTRENVCRCVVVYAAFSTFAYCVNVLLASRFLGVPHDIARILSRVSLVAYMLFCILNWAWQAYYIQRLLWGGHEHWTVYVYLLLVWLPMYDDITLFKWLLQNARNMAFTASQHRGYNDRREHNE